MLKADKKSGKGVTKNSFSDFLAGLFLKINNNGSFCNS